MQRILLLALLALACLGCRGSGDARDNDREYWAGKYRDVSPDWAWDESQGRRPVGAGGVELGSITVRDPLAGQR